MIDTVKPWFLVIAVLVVGPRPGPAAAPAQFNRDVRPILSDNCYQCHGPDKNQRRAGLRLDTQEGAAKVLTPGDPAKSELFRRVTAHDQDHMPPRKSGRTLTAAQIDTLKRWLEQGAKWEKHWSFLSPVRAPLPAVKNSGWARNAIDRLFRSVQLGRRMQKQNPFQGTAGSIQRSQCIAVKLDQ